MHANTTYSLITDKKDVWKKEEGIPVLQLEAEELSLFQKFLSDHSVYLNGDLTIRAYNSSGIGTSYIVFDNANNEPIADITDYNSW